MFMFLIKINCYLGGRVPGKGAIYYLIIWLFKNTNSVFNAFNGYLKIQIVLVQII